MNRKTLFALGLGLAFTLGLGSCKDNDLTDGSTGGDGGSEQNDALAQKYQTLQNLLGSLASVDSLPDNWNSNNYTVAPTVGVLKDDATPHVRYVVTSSQEEADRIYRSYLMKNVTGSPSDDQWQMEGIGSMQFKLENEPNLYATLRVNVQQLPALEEIRFVNEEALGSNGLFAPTGCYYSFGDVVCERKASLDENGQKVVTPTYWVCVRPCSMNPKRRQSHWCSLQLVPSGQADVQNYRKVNDHCYLPTQLAKDRGDAERMVQNYFNVLRLMADPSVALGEKYTGIDDISKTNLENSAATYKQLRDESFMWNYYDLWNPEAKFGYQSPSGAEALFEAPMVSKSFQVKDGKSFKTVFGGSEAEGVTLGAFYYGYSRNFFAKGDYSVYDMQLTAKRGEPFLQVTKQTPYVMASEQSDFREFASGNPEAAAVHYSQGTVTPDYQLVVRYRSGAEFDGKKQSANDVEPADPFKSTDVHDVLVHKAFETMEAYEGFLDDGKKPANASLLPFFAFGDVVTATPSEYVFNMPLTRFCILPAHSYYYGKEVKGVSLNSWVKNALFVSGPRSSTLQDTPVQNPTDQEVVAALLPMVQACIRHDATSCKAFGVKALDNSVPYDRALATLYSEIVSPNMGYNAAYRDNKQTVVLQLEVKVKDDLYYSIELKKPTGSQEEGTYLVNKSSEPVLSTTKNKLNFFRYQDEYAYRETYSFMRSLEAVTRTERTELKNAVPQQVVSFLEGLTFKKLTGEK